LLIKDTEDSARAPILIMRFTAPQLMAIQKTALWRGLIVALVGGTDMGDFTPFADFES